MLLLHAGRPWPGSGWSGRCGPTRHRRTRSTSSRSTCPRCGGYWSPSGGPLRRGRAELVRRRVRPRRGAGRRRPGRVRTRGGPGRVARARGDVERAATELHRALELWHGQALGNVSGDFLDVERDRLDELRATVVEERVRTDLDLGRHREIVPELSRLAAEFPSGSASRRS
ncbi:BTAD domain-containing putative transcriptional regulator [Streptomyces sp. M19]